MVSRKIVRTLAWLALVLTLWRAQTPIARAQDEVTWLLTQINNLRASLGLPPYSLNPQLSAAATLHSQYMVSTCDVSHTEANGSTPTSRARAQGYTGSWISENIYMGQLARAEDAWNFWINSPIHYQGLTHNVVNEVGIGVAYGECGQGYTLLFGYRDNVSAPPAPPAPSASGSGESAPPPPTQAPYVPPPPTRTPTPTVPTITPSYTWTPTPLVSASPTQTATRTATATKSSTPLVLPTVAASDTAFPAPTAIAQLPTASATTAPAASDTSPPTPAASPRTPPPTTGAPAWLPLTLLVGAALLGAVGGWLLWRAR